MPHDSVFKACMSHLKVARAMVEQFVPESTQKLLDLDTMRIANRSFMDASMRQTHADMVYSVDRVSRDGGALIGRKKAYVHLLWEHHVRSGETKCR